MSEFRIEDHPVVFLKPRLSHPYAWVGHVPFAYLLVDLLRPRTLVELGTDSGNSYLAFCQAVQQLGVGTQCTAIDTWEGDPHARRYGEGVYETLKSYHDPRYAAFSRMHRSLFIDALGEFEDGSIDLLHIDGLHTYEAVSEDFNTWLPKLSDRSVVIFHDSQVRDRGFGVAQFLDEIRGTYRIVEFEHSNGLGVAMVGDKVPEAFVAFMDAFDKRTEQMRRFFKELGDALVSDNGTAGGARSEQVTPDVTCRVFYRNNDESYDESRVIMAEFSAPSGPLSMELAFPENARPTFIRIDPADHAGVFEISDLYLTIAGKRLHAENLVGRVGQVSGDVLPGEANGRVRVVAFSEDPHVEFAIADLIHALPSSGILNIALTVNFEVVLNDPTFWSLARAQERALQELKRKAPVSVQAGPSLNDIATTLAAMQVAGVVLIPGGGPSLYGRSITQAFDPQRRVRGQVVGLDDVVVVRFDLSQLDEKAFVRIDVPAMPGTYRLSALAIDDVAVLDLRRRVIAVRGELLDGTSSGAVTVSASDAPPYIELDVSDFAASSSLTISVGRDLRSGMGHGSTAISEGLSRRLHDLEASVAAVQLASAEQAATITLRFERVINGLNQLNERAASTAATVDQTRAELQQGRHELAALTQFEQGRGILRRIWRRLRRKF